MSDGAAVIVDVPGLPVRVLVVRLVRVVVLMTCHADELATRRAASANAAAWDRPSSAARWGNAAGRIGAAMRLSARNKINATVTAITRGEATANVVMDAGGTRLVASITVEAASELGLAEGSQVVAIIKASDVIVGVLD